MPPQTLFTNHSADFSSRESELPYTVEGIEPQDSPFWVLAIVDDDGSGWQFGPGTGDLLALDQGDLYPVEMTEAGEFELNLDLNTVHISTN